ncbi:Urease accessory protein UreF [Halothece sp. PCC 7418]|uniref:urease accessory protein UreF n=1 Tax=Halothece sp. (strain PCC 7418) TaxID=65093 RepID=UPI0002A0733B|nr:urease accessory protein UreF [Halothece sp. PCC 7418]AFZ43700.1 Urease accessory protein UreF [Halothece sp. PCC 7418]
MILKLLQLSSSALPLGAYSYSEGLETAIETQMIQGEEGFKQWLQDELSHGAIRLETALMLRGYRCWQKKDLEGLQYWNQWGSAVKETAELREQSWQMGNTLTRLLLALDSNPKLKESLTAVGKPCNSAIAFGIGAANWEIDEYSTVLGYLHSWATNLINAGVKLIPLGQTTGQQLLLQLHANIETTATTVLNLADDELYTCSWGLGLASMQHETQYSRLFRS